MGPPERLRVVSVPERNSTQTTGKDLPPTGRGLSLRALVVGLFLVVVTSLIVCHAELINGNIQIGFLQMPPAAIGIFFFLVVINAELRRLGRWMGFNATELLMIYCMMIVSAMVSSRGIMEKIIPVLVTPNYFGSATNRWQQLFFPHIPKWMVAFDPDGPTQQEVSKRFFEGLRDGQQTPWHQWAVPLATWGILVLLVLFAFLCLASILRRQWVDNEKLAFPLAQLPLDLARNDQTSILSSRALWAGVAVPGVVFTLNGLHNIYPSVPQVRLEFFVDEFLVNPPWDKLYFTPMYFSFAAIGFFFLLPAELLFSVWFFALLARLQGVGAVFFGMETRGMPVYGTPLIVAYQTVGAYFVLVGYLIYVSVPHLKRVLRSAMGAGSEDDSNELIPYGVAFWGLVISFMLILWWCWMAGMSPWVALLEFGVFIFVIAIVMARCTAEAGMLMTETSFRPVDVYRMFAPVHSLGPGNLTMMAFFDVAFLRDQRGLLFTGFMDGLKMSDGANCRRRAFLPVFVVAILASLVVGGALHIWIPYDRGAVTLYGHVYRSMNIHPFYDYQSHMLNSYHMTWHAPVFFGVGVVVTAFLSYMRGMFLWWPLHPLGYALSTSWTATVFWFPALVAWALKGWTLKYGGMRTYVKARPFFLGLVLGEFGMAVVWALVGMIADTPLPRFPWP